MSIEKAAVIAQMIAVLELKQGYDSIVTRTDNAPVANSGWNEASVEEVLTLLISTIERLAPPDSTFARRLAEEMAKHRHPTDWYSIDPDPFHFSGDHDRIRVLTGLLKALLFAYQHDCLANIREIVRAELFSDFLDMAQHLLGESFVDAAIVIAGGVLEEHLRKLSSKFAVDLTYKDNSGKEFPKKLDRLNADLAKQTAYPSTMQKQITAWAGIRNDPAHGKYNLHTADQIDLMIHGIRLFVSSHPA
jgi:hypothetical protein